MSDDHIKEGVVIDVTPESEESRDSHETSSRASEQSASAGAHKLPLIIAILALLLVSGALVFAYQYAEQAAQDLARINARLDKSMQQQDSLKNQLDSADNTVLAQQNRLDQQTQSVDQQKRALLEASEKFAKQEALLERERQRMEEREAELRASVADVHKRVGASGTQWMVSEAEYLLRVANHRLTLARDTGTARSAMLLADQRLHDTEDPGWNLVREQIARDMTKLDAANLPDSAGISAKLGALAEQVPQLKLTNATIGAERTLPEGSSKERSQRNWDTLLNDLWDGFKDSVRVRQRDKPVQAMLAPDQQFFLYENIRLHLESARLAVVRNDRTLFIDSLNTASKWLSNHFDSADTLTQNMKKTLVGLKSINIRPALPDISQSLRTLKIRQKLNRDLAQPIKPAS